MFGPCKCLLRRCLEGISEDYYRGTFHENSGEFAGIPMLGSAGSYYTNGEARSPWRLNYRFQSIYAMLVKLDHLPK